MAFASLFVPDFPVQAVVRLEPELQGKAVAVLAGAPPLTKVFAVNREARSLGVEAGMTKVQAEAFQGIIWRWRSLSQEATAYAALLDCAWTISPRIEDGAKPEGQDFCDTAVLDIAGCEKLFGSPEKIARDLRRVSLGSSTRMFRSARYRIRGRRCASPVRFHRELQSFQQIWKATTVFPVA